MHKQRLELKPVELPNSRPGFSIHHQSPHTIIELRARDACAVLAARCAYSIPNGPPGPSTARARFGPALCGPMAFSCRAVPGVVPNWRPRHGPMADFSGRAGTTPRTARWAATRHGTIADGMEARATAQAAHGGRRGRSSGAPRRRLVRPELQPPRRI
jgi:hypothetical protein